MPVILTPQQLQAKLQRIALDTIPTIEDAMGDATLLVEKRARDNCSPGKSPYWRAPYSDDNDPRREPPHMRDVMFSEVRIEGRSVKGIVGNPKRYAAPVHEGATRKSMLGGRIDVMKARPFIADAINEEERNIRIILSDAIYKSLKKECVS
jgi:hypothetical protein